MALSARAVVLLLLGLVPVALVPSERTVVLWWLVCALVIAADVALAASPRKLAMWRGPSSPIRLGQSVVAPLALRYDGRRRARGIVRDAWVPSAGALTDRHPVSLTSGEVAVVETTLTPTRCGDRRAHVVTARLFGPLGVAGRQGSFAVPGAVRVRPPFASRKHLPSLLTSLRQLDGRSAVRTRGQGTEFDSLREYVEGDDVRSIDWRASARARDLVVRTWQPERDRHIVIVLDCSRTSAGRVGDVPRLDAAIESALLLTALATRAGDRVDVIAADRWLRASASTRRAGLSGRAAGSGAGGPGPGEGSTMTAVMDALSLVEPVMVEADWDVIAAAVLARAKRRALVVLLTPLEPAALESGLLPKLPVLLRSHHVMLGCVRNPELDERADRADPYELAALERAIAERARLVEVFASIGAHVVDAPPDQLPLSVSQHYLSLKSRGQL